MANYTIRVIMENFEMMLVEMPFDKVTVSALVQRCGISSNTFYYHFRDIYDLLNKWLALQEKKYFHDTEEYSDWSEPVKMVLKAMQDNPRLIFHIYDTITRKSLEQFIFGPVQELFYKAAKKHIGNVEVSETFLQDFAEFCGYSLLGFVLKFLHNRMKADVDETVDRLNGIFEGVADYMIDKEIDRKKQNTTQK